MQSQISISMLVILTVVAFSLVRWGGDAAGLRVCVGMATEELVKCDEPKGVLQTNQSALIVPHTGFQ